MTIYNPIEVAELVVKATNDLGFHPMLIAYIQLTDTLLWSRKIKPQFEDSKEEEFLLDIMDSIWYQLSRDEMKIANSLKLGDRHG